MRGLGTDQASACHVWPRLERRCQSLRIVLGLAVLAVAGPAMAGEVCISCSEPSADYRCTIDGSEKLQELALEETVLGPVCEKVLARTLGHASCRVVVNPGEPCKGTLEVVTLAEIQKAMAGPEAESTYVPSLTERAASASASVTKGVGDAASKSWRCLSSFFQDC